MVVSILFVCSRLLWKQFASVSHLAVSTVTDKVSFAVDFKSLFEMVTVAYCSTPSTKTSCLPIHRTQFATEDVLRGTVQQKGTRRVEPVYVCDLTKENVQTLTTYLFLLVLVVWLCLP